MLKMNVNHTKINAWAYSINLGQRKNVFCQNIIWRLNFILLCNRDTGICRHMGEVIPNVEVNVQRVS